MFKFIRPIAIASFIILAAVTTTNTVHTNTNNIRIAEETNMLYMQMQMQSEEAEDYWNEQVKALYASKAANHEHTFMLCKTGDQIDEIPSNESIKETDDFTFGFGDISFEDMYSVQINKGYDIPQKFYFEVLPESMYPIIPSVCELEKTQDISSMFLLAVAATETGWGTTFYEKGSNNWFNWTADAITYQWFDSADSCVQYTGEKFKERFFNSDFYAQFGQYVEDDVYTVSEVNTRYAINNDHSVNWLWSDVVCEIMYSFNTKYQMWEIDNYDL